MYGNLKVEELRNGIWWTLGDFPFAEESIGLYSMVTFNEVLYLFGTFSFDLKSVIIRVVQAGE